MAALNTEGSPYGLANEFPFAVGIGDTGTHRNHTTLDIRETQALIAVDPPEPYPYFHIILLDRIDGSNWIVADPEGKVEALDLRTEQVIPLVRGHTFPDAGRPFLAFVHLTEVMLAGLRAQSKALHLIVKAQAPLGAAGAAGTSSSDSQWLFSDPARACFNQPVPVDVLADSAKVSVMDSVGVVMYLDAADDEQDEERPVSIELVSDKDRADWIRAKRQGAGRDPRLMPLQPTSRKTKVQLFSAAFQDFDHSVKPDKTRFPGPPATEVVLRSIAESGLEITAYGNEFLRLHNVPSNSATAKMYMYLLHAFQYLVCVDRLDPMHLSVAEHLSRKVLQQQKAIQRNPKNPDFTGLEEYERHAKGATGEMYAPEWDKHVSEQHRNQALIDRNQRLAAEEKQLAVSASPKKGAKGKNGNRTTADLDDVDA